MMQGAGPVASAAGPFAHDAKGAMARPPNAAQTARTSAAKAGARGAGAPVRARGSTGRTLAILLAIAAGAVLATPTFLVLLVGMAPTWIALVTDQDPGRLRSHAIGAMNLAGAVPFLFDLWQGANTVADALRLLGDVFVWLAMLGSAALGVGLATVGPHAAAAILGMLARRRATRLQEEQRRLVTEWGRTLLADAAARRHPDDT